MNKALKADAALFLAAFFWGTTFIFQRQAMDHLSPLAYTAVRFLLGALALMPLVIPRARRALAETGDRPRLLRLWAKGCGAAGCFLFVGIAFQQYGLVWTTAGKAGFITSLYVVLVPIILLLAGRKILFGEMLGAVLAVAGLYLLSFSDRMELSYGDGLVLIGACVWAGHVLCIGWFSPKMDSVVLGAGQALVCGVISAFGTLVLEQLPSLAVLADAWLSILWGGIFSVALGFTLQVVGQRNANPAAAAIILQMEAVIAAVAGWLLLSERMTGRMIVGAVVMLAGFLVSQLWPIFFAKTSDSDDSAPVESSEPER